MASCVRNIRTKNYQNLIIGFKVTVKNVGDVFFQTQCMTSCAICRTIRCVLYNLLHVSLSKSTCNKCFSDCTRCVQSSYNSGPCSAQIRKFSLNSDYVSFRFV